jgi:hypothetical protein
MTEPITSEELQARLGLIETMIAEGRRTTARWGWAFLFWGVAYFVAFGWSITGHSGLFWLAWPVTMGVACVLFAIIATQKARSEPATGSGRAIGAVWIAMAITMFLIMPSVALSGRSWDWHIYLVLVTGIMGMANAASSIILRWRAQFLCAVVWWASSAAACFGSDRQATGAFLAAIFFCQIIFGVYCMISEARLRSQRGTAHA